MRARAHNEAMNTDPKGTDMASNHITVTDSSMDSDVAYIVEMAQSGKALGQRGRVAWSSIAVLVPVAALHEAVSRGLVTTEKVTDGTRSALHVIAC
jgi:hypothetical protein